MASRPKRPSPGILPPLRRKYSELRWWQKTLVFLFLLMAASASTAAAGLHFFYAHLASQQDLSDLGRMPQRSIVYDRNEEIVGRLHGANRIVVSAKDVSPFFVDAIVAREDARFFSHHGVDYLGALRALLRNVKDKRFVQGASTITMQLARNSYFTADKTLHRKLLEIAVARRIEDLYTKEEILTYYINRIYFGAGLYGIDRAAQDYFHKHPRDLSLGEAALLAGIIRAPSRLSPLKHYEDALEERDAVLTRMVDEGYASDEEVARARGQPISVYPVTYVKEQENYALDAVRRDLDLFLEEADTEDGGFNIHTTLDMRLQRAAEAALENHLQEIESSPGFRHRSRAAFGKSFNPNQPQATDYVQGAVVVLDNDTGGLVAIVGGRDFNHSKFNRALLSRRQIGSAFKPFVYATAFQRGLMPGTLVDDSAIARGEIPSVNPNWSPRNSDGKYNGLRPAAWGLIKSRNTMSVRVGAYSGLESVIDTTRTLALAREIEPTPQVYIGNLGATLKALTSAFSVFPNHGVLMRPFIIETIGRGDSPELRATPVVELPVLPAGAAWMTSTILEDVITEGTASAVGRLGFQVPAGGKTGTTNDYTDAWFVGYTSRLTCGVWIGMDQPSTIMDRGYGSRLALPIWVEIMKAAEEYGYPGEAFAPPVPLALVELCGVSGLLATPNCQRAQQAYSSEIPYEMIPRESCAFHGWQPRHAGRGRGLFNRILDLFR